jgi:hypothetical protein
MWMRPAPAGRGETTVIMSTPTESEQVNSFGVADLCARVERASDRDVSHEQFGSLTGRRIAYTGADRAISTSLPEAGELLGIEVIDAPPPTRDSDAT